ncbi:MAG: calcium/sodium antiporter [Bacteroidales bacterium]
MIIPVIFLLSGLVFVVVGGEFLVKSSVQIARHYGLSSMVVGLTVVAFGTSAPELFVCLDANISEHADIALGNVLGSNVANIALVLACVSIIYPIKIVSQSILQDWIVMFLSTVLLLFFFIDNNLSRLEAGVLFTILLLFIYRSLRQKNIDHRADNNKCIPPVIPMWKASLIALGACVALSVGSEFLVNGASEIAIYFGVDERIISISLIAFGTSIPELSTSIIAAIKKQIDISVGNLIGSNIFNVGAVLGITGIIKPIEISDFVFRYNVDIIMVCLVSMLLLFFILPLYKVKITRIKGFIFLSLYCIYIIALFYNVTFIESSTWL